ncbi:MAG: hypothetical protein D3908_09455 [Candidatus Electrothrix sp. AUS4]|nr:hypothetical protein [Candidatus Electrothrix sp. AUS4]
MKFQFTLFFLILSGLMFIGEVVFNCDLIKCIYILHNTVLDRSVLAVVLVAVGLVTDYIIGIKKKKEREKAAAYNAAVRTANHLLRGVMSSMMVLSESKAVREEFGNDITGIMEKNIQRIEEILEGLTGLKEITPEMIREISAPTES